MDTEENNVISIIALCHLCKREIKDSEIYYKHPKYGIVCEYCPEFADGGISVEEKEEDEE